jgi:hypothetical protein
MVDTKGYGFTEQKSKLLAPLANELYDRHTGFADRFSDLGSEIAGEYGVGEVLRSPVVYRMDEVRDDSGFRSLQINTLSYVVVSEGTEIGEGPRLGRNIFVNIVDTFRRSEVAVRQVTRETQGFSGGPIYRMGDDGKPQMVGIVDLSPEELAAFGFDADVLKRFSEFISIDSSSPADSVNGGDFTEATSSKWLPGYDPEDFYKSSKGPSSGFKAFMDELAKTISEKWNNYYVFDDSEEDEEEQS